jgi:hypothetical protein
MLVLARLLLLDQVPLLLRLHAQSAAVSTGRCLVSRQLAYGSRVQHTLGTGHVLETVVHA